MGISNEHVWLSLHKAFSSRLRVLRAIGEACEGDVTRLITMASDEFVKITGKSADSVKIALNNLSDATQECSRLEDENIKIISFKDRNYPSSLLDLTDFPPLIYAKGNLSLFEKGSIGICGSRGASEDGLRFAKRFGQIASDATVPVTSGYAKGVDTTAHLSALESHGQTIVTLAEGILQFRIKREFKSIHDFFDRTLVVSQFYPRHIWQISRAMERNKIICGLSRALVVVEAGEKGGTIAAGRESLRQGKPTLVVERKDPHKTAPGNQMLISEGAHPLNSTEALQNALTNVANKSALPNARKNVRISQQMRLPAI